MRNRVRTLTALQERERESEKTESDVFDAFDIIVS